MIEHTAPISVAEFRVKDLVVLKRQMLNWASRFNIFLFLDNHQYSIQPNCYECLLGAGSRASVNETGQLDAFVQAPHWRFGHLAYDLKAELHGLCGHEDALVGFPHLHFFEPEAVLFIKGNVLTIEAVNPEAVWKQLMEQQALEDESTGSVELTPRLTRNAYLQAIQQLQQHILRGDCYEINFCQEFFAEKAFINPIAVFQKLSKASPAPFAALYRYEDAYLISASPERFLTKQGSKLVAQPMKGTARRKPAGTAADEQQKRQLYASAKERSENVMVVDLVRNDLAQVCTGGSVKVDELYGIYTFPQVHQMVSTISGTIRPEVTFMQLLQANFPMGSMTGAPKLRVMQLIDQYEQKGRGIFSGSVGYFSPEGNFDFSVVIRSLVYNARDGYLSCKVGSGITFYSDAAQEWEECLLKATAIREVLQKGEF